ncbi:endonuclease [Amycolatopsis sp. OK19-0408]|uniref:Endonuclease n=1 Tax=Amycolatopsis iheyensis TaxID=2945988 RepID=A0A9X2N9X6_9PSEU|nr:endonuclease [Amycolatopsis iheyensis]MCR6483140.1 endonuclease [Amycolatopsis iheyensis]
MTHRDKIQCLLAEAGPTYAAEAGIKLADTPAPLYRLLVLSVLLSTRIKAAIAVDAARELKAAGLGTAVAMKNATWQQRVDALGRAHYKRYDEQTATALGEGAQVVLDSYGGDLRRLREAANGEFRTLAAGLRKVPRLGPVGVDIFAREVQAVWPEFRPHLDGKALRGAEKLGLPTEPGRLAKLVGGDRLAALAAALVRVTLERDLADRVT